MGTSKQNYSKRKTQQSYSVENVHVPKADSRRDMVDYKALMNALDEIEKAKKNGKYECYVTTEGYLPKAAIRKLIDAGYDLKYSHFNDGLWFIKACWQEGCSGKIEKEDILYNKNRKVTIEEMFQEMG